MFVFYFNITGSTSVHSRHECQCLRDAPFSVVPTADPGSDWSYQRSVKLPLVAVKQERRSVRVSPIKNRPEFVLEFWLVLTHFTNSWA